MSEFTTLLNAKNPGLRTILARMTYAAKASIDHKVSNDICRHYERLAHQGALFEPKLTAAEMKFIAKFM